MDYIFYFRKLCFVSLKFPECIFPHFILTWALNSFLCVFSICFSSLILIFMDSKSFISHLLMVPLSLPGIYVLWFCHCVCLAMCVNIKSYRHHMFNWWAVSKYNISFGAFACKPVIKRRILWSITSKSLRSFYVKPVQNSLLNKQPFKNHAFLRIRPISVFYFLRGYLEEWRLFGPKWHSLWFLCLGFRVGFCSNCR